jgi:hypothetical protein
VTLQTFRRLNAKAQSRQALKLVYDSPQALHKAWSVEIQKETKPPVREPQVGEELSGVDWKNLLNGLDFHDEFILDQQIQSVTVVNLEHAIIDDRHLLFGHHTAGSLAQLVNQAYPIDALQKTWPQF